MNVAYLEALFWSWWNIGTALLLVMFFGSIATIPVLVAFLKGTIPANGKLANALFTLGMMNLGRGALVLAEDGNYRMAPVNTDGDETYVTTQNGEYEVDNPTKYWTRMGMRPFTVTYEKGPTTFGEFRADLDDPGGDTIKADGGDYQVYGEPRGGKPEWSPYTEEPYDEYVLNLPRLVRTLHDFGAGGVEAANEAEQHALKEHGGSSEWGQIAFLGAVFGALLLGSVMGYVVMVGF